MTEQTETVHKIAGTAHEAAAAHAGGAHHEAHEFPNFIKLLAERFHDSELLQFLHRYENLVFSGAILLLISSFLIIAARRYAVVPGGFRNFAEALVEGIENFVVSILGETGRKHVPFLGTLFLYIVVMNYCGLFPLFKAPTSTLSTTLPLALFSLCYIHYWGLRELGLKNYLHHIAGSPSNVASWIIGIILIFPLNLMLEYIAVPLSLSVRLFANISSEDRLLYKFAGMNVDTNWLAFPLQLFGNAMAFLFSAIQAFVFTLLTTVYIKTMLPHEEHHEHSDETAGAH